MFGMAMNDDFLIRIKGAPPPVTNKAKSLSKSNPSSSSSSSALSQQCFNLRLRPSTSLDEFRQEIFSLFQIPSPSRSHYRIGFLTGFPPVELNAHGKNNVGQLGISPHETVMVKFSHSQTNETVATATRPKRATAVSASTSFKKVIQQSPRKKRNIQMVGTGYRLSDGKAFPSTAKRTALTSQRQQPLFHSEDDIATTLLSSLAGQNRGNVGKFLRAAMKGAVAKSYEVARAQVRVSAVNQGEYQLENINGDTSVDGGVVVRTCRGEDSDNDAHEDGRETETTVYQVTYAKGLEGRGMYTEKVQIIGWQALQGVVQAVYESKSSSEDANEDSNQDSITNGREMLRPASIAQLSPRVFWSLVYHYKKRILSSNQKEQLTSTDHPAVEDMLRSLMPQLDWTHLDRGGRKRNLSEKAKENLRQKRQELTAIQSSITAEEHEAGVSAIQEIENIILENLDEKDTDSNKRERGARAALSRFDDAKFSVSKNESWILVTPTEQDVEEIKECIMDNFNVRIEPDPKQKYAIEEIVNSYSLIVMSELSEPFYRNWRELASANSDTLLSKLIQECEKQKLSTTEYPLSLDVMEQWIDAAQHRSLEEIMLEIIDGDGDLLELLAEKAHSSTPRDLIHWQFYPKMLLDNISSPKYDEHDVLRWVCRAKTAIKTNSWLELYTTPVG